MKPVSPSEKLLFSTVRISSGIGVGTGFFFNFSIDGKIVPAIITNKHVVDNKKETDVVFSVHLSAGNNQSKESKTVSLTTDWIFHPDPKIDLCCNLTDKLYSTVRKQTGRKVFCYPLDENELATKAVCEHLSAMEEVTMFGSPKGLWEMQNNFPLIRKGYTACHPSIDFNWKSVGVLDIVAFPGSSGSPVLIVNEQPYLDKYGKLHESPRILLLGVLYAGEHPEKNMDPDLGYYVKADEILALKELVRKELIKRAMGY